MAKNKIKVEKMIRYLYTIVSVLTILVGIQGLRMLKTCNENTQYMYEYYNWTRLIDEVNINVANMQLNRVKAEHGYDSKYQENINVNNVNIVKYHNEYMSAPNESEEELKYLENIKTCYTDYYKVTTEALETLKRGEGLSDETKQKLESLENNLQVNITGVKKYLANWADTDKSDMDKVYVRTKILYIVIITVCMIISIGSGLFVANVSSKHFRELKRMYRKSKPEKEKKGFEENGKNKEAKGSKPKGIDRVKEIQRMREVKAEKEKEEADEIARLKELKSKRELEETQARKEMKEAEAKAKQKELELRREVAAFKAREEARARKKAEEARAKKEAERAKKEAERARKEKEKKQAKKELELTNKLELTGAFDGIDDLDDLEAIKELMNFEGISNTSELEILEELGELE